MSDPIAPRPIDNSGGVSAAIRRAADATGVDFSLLVETARRESAMDPNARARTSSATGLFQFIDSTWLDMVRRHGAAHGLGQYSALLQSGQADAATRRDILALRSDPELSARFAGELARENAAALENQLGRAPSAGELYAAHVLGAGGAAKLIAAAQSGASDASALFPREAGANRGLFYASSGQARSAQGLLDRLDIEAGGAISAPAAPASGPLSPTLAHALFALALMPLLRGDDEQQSASDPLTALMAYRRAQGGA
jgi:Transglycosylase SLT domain